MFEDGRRVVVWTPYAIILFIWSFCLQQQMKKVEGQPTPDPVKTSHHKRWLPQVLQVIAPPQTNLWIYDWNIYLGVTLYFMAQQ